jgi:hypothetical protein
MLKSLALTLGVLLGVIACGLFITVFGHALAQGKAGRIASSSRNKDNDGTLNLMECPISKEVYAKIKKGMTLKEVGDVIGVALATPDYVRDLVVNCTDGTRKVVLTFKKDKKGTRKLVEKKSEGLK